MKLKSLFCAFAAVALVGVVASCEQHDEEEPLKPFDAAVMEGMVSTPTENAYRLSFGFFNDIPDGSMIAEIMVKSDRSEGGVIPEGVYRHGTEAPCIYKDYWAYGLRNPGGKHYASFTDSSLTVEHVDNEYHLVFHAVDENGRAYDFDWTGRLKSRDNGALLYHPGEAPAQ